MTVRPKSRFPLILILVLAETAVLLSAAVVLLRHRNACINQGTLAETSEWQSRVLEYNDGWEVVPNDNEEAEKPQTLLYGPYVSVPRSGYTLHIWYACDKDQSAEPSAAGNNGYYVKAGTAVLSSKNNYITYRFFVMHPVDNLEILVKYNGQGHFRINKIELYKNTDMEKQRLVWILIFFVLLDFIIAKKEYLCSNRKTVLCLMGISVLLSIPLFVPGYNPCVHHDLKFHLMRIEGLASELLNGQFPVRLSSEWMNGYGYPNSIYYGDILLYLPAALRIMGFPLITAYKLFVFAVNVFTVLIAYFTFNDISGNTQCALITALIYGSSTYRLMDIYERSAVGEFCAMMFLPVVAGAMYRIIRHGFGDDKSEIKKNALYLALGMTGLIQTHILTTEMVIFFLILISVIWYKEVFQKKSMLTVLSAITMTLVINLWFLVPFLDYYKNVRVNINNTVENVKLIQSHGAYVGQLFAFSQSIFGKSTASVADRMCMTPGPVMMGIFFIGLTVLLLNRTSKTHKVLVLLSGVALFMSTSSFPWNWIGANTEIGRLLSQVQFPWRYLGIASLFIALLFCELFTEFENNEKLLFWLRAGMIIAVLSVSSIASDYCSGTDMRNWYDIAEIGTYQEMMGEYLPIGINKRKAASLHTDIISEKMESAALINREGCHIELNCSTGEEDGKFVLPVFFYKGYQAYSEPGVPLIMEEGENNEIVICVPKHFTGNIYVDYKSPWYWRVSEIVSLMSCICLCFIFCRHKSSSENISGKIEF